MRRMIAALQVSLDGYIEGPDGQQDWIDTWEDVFELAPQIDTCVLGGKTYPGYAQYWHAARTAPDAPLPFTGAIASPGERRYAEFAEGTPHVVLSTTIASVDWGRATLARSLDEVRQLKALPGRDIYAVGGATLVSSLVNASLVDEIRLVIHPVVLGGGKALFSGVTGRRALELTAVTQLGSSRLRLIYRTASPDAGGLTSRMQPA